MGWKDAFKAITDKGENMLSDIPVLGGLLGAESTEQKNLRAKQQQMAVEAEKRMRVNQEARMNALTQSMLAFDPYNQMVAQMVGPGAAFSPQQMQQMAQNPMKPQLDPSLYGYQGTDPRKEAEIKKFMADMDAYQANEARRQEMLANGLRPLPASGAAPLQQRAPLAAKRY